MAVRLTTTKRAVPIVLMAIIGMIIITSQSPVAFAGYCIDDDNDGYYAQGCGGEIDCDDENPEVWPGNGCVDGKKSIEIDSDVKDGVVVGPDDIVVISNGATVEGNVEVNGGTLVITESSTIKGNIESDGGTILIEENSLLEGNVNIVVSGAGGVLKIDGAELKGNLETSGIDTLRITDSYINGNITSENDGDVTITGNSVNGSLEIYDPSSCSESSNDVNGNNFGCP